MPKLEETNVYLDEGYLSKISKHLGGGTYLSFDYNQFAITLARENNLWCNSVFYYTAPPFISSPPTENEKARQRGYDKLMAALRRIPNFNVREGRCQKVEGEYKQKGVDTLMTMDLMDLTRNEKVKNIVVLTADTDFVPVLNKLRTDFQIKVVLAYYNDYVRKSKFSMSNHLQTACDKHFLIEKKHFEMSFRG